MSWSGPDDFLERLQNRLHATDDASAIRVGGDGHFLDDAARARLRDAGVLIGVVDRGEDDLNVILTKRPATMANHPGQVAFPGGKVDPIDKDAVEAALREAHEEVGLHPNMVNVQGQADIYVTGTGFRITPVVGLLPSEFQPVPDPYEVDEVFETPLSFLMNPSNHIRRQATWQGMERRYYEMPHNGNRIWGVTAGVIRALYKRLYAEDEEIK